MTVRGLPVLARREPAELEGLDGLFKGFADPNRIRILNLLAAGELCVCDLVDILGLAQPTVSRHLGYLRRTGLVHVARDGKFAHYRLSDPSSAVHEKLLQCVQESFTRVRSLGRERAWAAKRAAARASEPC